MATKKGATSATNSNTQGGDAAKPDNAADQANNGGDGAGEGTNPQGDAANTTGEGGDGAAAANTSGDKTFTQAELDAQIAAEKKQWAADLKKEKERADMSETERAKAETADLRAQLRERDARDSVAGAAEAAGAKSGQRVYKIVSADLEFDNDGKITNLKDVIATAKTDFPELFQNKPEESIDAGAKDAEGKRAENLKDALATYYKNKK